jgi:hypothetical protein
MMARTSGLQRAKKARVKVGGETTRSKHALFDSLLRNSRVHRSKIQIACISWDHSTTRSFNQSIISAQIRFPALFRV